MSNRVTVNKVTVDKVYEIAQGRSYEANSKRYGKTTKYPTEIRADVSDGNGSHTGVTIQIDGMKEGQHMLAEHITAGTEICCYDSRSNRYGTTFPVAISDTKKLLDVGGYSGGGGHSSGGHSGGFDSTGMKVGAVMHDACTLLAGTLTSKSDVMAELDTVKLIASSLYDMSCELTKEKSGSQSHENGAGDVAKTKPAHNHTPDMQAIKDALKGQSFLTEHLNNHAEPENLCKEYWLKANNDPDLFVRKLTRYFEPQEPEQEEGYAEDNLPF